MSGGGIVAVKYCDGVLMASDTLVSRGIKTKANYNRAIKVGTHGGILTTGSIGDTQSMEEYVRELELEDLVSADGFSQTSPKEIYSYLKLVIYNKRSNFEPWMVGTIVGGKEKGKEPFIGWINSLGNHFEGNCASAGIAHYLCDNILQDATEGDKWKSLSRDDAKKLIESCMRILVVQDAAGFSRVQLTELSDAGFVNHDTFEVEGDKNNYDPHHTVNWMK
eukprot:TRINITY_DN956_c0_g1_i7.p1 TRINITY_DN956_c0_g1~~TRINITY_DN956_c0_g1_i7.p1  ORF type:complete len:221 (+),score=38.06 TRINITY_DN956_c0_g1_i7:54-716(+)